MNLNPDQYLQALSTLNAIPDQYRQALSAVKIDPEQARKEVTARLHQASESVIKLRNKMDHYHRTHLDENIMRDTPLRYLAYTDQVAQALSPYINQNWLGRSTRIGVIYSILDAIGMGHKSYHHSKETTWRKKMKESLHEIGEGTLFHIAASMIIPGIIIKGTRHATHHLLSRASFAPRIAKRAPLISSALALSTLPFLSKPVDKMTEAFLHKLFHPTVKKLQAEMETIRKMREEQLKAKQAIPAEAPEARSAVLTSPVSASSLQHPKVFETMFR